MSPKPYRLFFSRSSFNSFAAAVGWIDFFCVCRTKVNEVCTAHPEHQEVAISLASLHSSSQFQAAHPSKRRRHVSTTTDALFSFLVIWSSLRLSFLSTIAYWPFGIGGRFWRPDDNSKSHFLSHQRKHPQSSTSELQL